MHIHCYDDYGNVDSTTLTATGTTETFTSSATYSADGNFLQSVTDSLGKVTEYNYDTTNKLLNYIENANGNKTAYKYDGRNRTTNVYLDADGDGELDEGVEAAVEYLYTKNRLSGIKTATTEYTLTYDSFGNLQTVKADNNTLATYEYAANNGKLLKLTYGNGDFEEYSYDSLDRLVKVVYNGTAESGYELQYDANGRLYQTIDYEAGITHIYEYDSLDRLIRAWQKNTFNGSVILGVENSYDAYGRAKGSTYVIGDTTQNYGITYKEISGLLDTYTTPHNSFTYSYDNFDRLTRKLGNKYSIQYVYDSGSQRVDTYTISQATSQQATYKYMYDALGNVRMIFKDDTFAFAYSYDALNRLTHESDVLSDIVYEYSYDNAGNILTKTTTVGSTVQSTVNYGYSTSEWGDLLTNYNGTTITYDELGNPLKWHNAISLTWDGRTLQHVRLTDNKTALYQYNADGIRIKKSRTMFTHDYVVDGSTILKETITNIAYSDNATTTLYYHYDESGISGVSYNGTMYSYVRNLQGDVIAIINANGVTVVEYKYDAWGNVLSVTGSMASTLGAVNPFRYRGYYYDTETGFYYLNSRYYDPQVGRFLNADGYVSTGQGLTGFNMFAYCNNNPVMYFDTNGMTPHYIYGECNSPLREPIHGGGGGTMIGCSDNFQKVVIWSNRYGNRDFESRVENEQGGYAKDVTAEVDKKLTSVASIAHMRKGRCDNCVGRFKSIALASNYLWFYNLVNHEEEWDIKTKDSWEKTIGTTFPGFDSVIIYNGEYMTVECVGNYTYGYIGRALGIPLSVLIAGSWCAADFPFAGEEVEGEFFDWKYVVKGYNAAGAIFN